MSVYDLKPHFQNLLRPLTNILASNGITANQITLLALLLSVLSGSITLAFSNQYPLTLLILPVALFVRMALNAIDGMLAREYDMKSKLGAVLNELGDVISDISMYLCFINFTSKTLLAVTLFLIILSEYIGVVGVMTGNGRRYDGPMGKSDRAVGFGTLALLLAFEPIERGPVNCMMILICLLLIRTCQNRINAASE